jgi:hypothetical protein
LEAPGPAHEIEVDTAIAAKFQALRTSDETLPQDLRINWHDSKGEILAIAASLGDRTKLKSIQNDVEAAVKAAALAKFERNDSNKLVADACKIVVYKTECVHVALKELFGATDDLLALPTMAMDDVD